MRLPLTLLVLQEEIAPALGFFWWVIIILGALLVLASMWRVYEKAGEPGWAVIVPIYNIIVLLRIAGKPLWWIFLFFIPLVNIVVAFIMNIGVARNFGRSAGFGVGLLLLGFIFYPILGFGDDTYRPVAGS